jgi:hypothetical protein
MQQGQEACIGMQADAPSLFPYTADIIYRCCLLAAAATQMWLREIRMCVNA